MLTNSDIKKLKSVFATKDDLKKSLRGVARKKDLIQMEKRITKKINYVIDHFDDEIIGLDKRVTRIEDHLHLTSIN